jgi:nucleoside diphosphate kinase
MAQQLAYAIITPYTLHKSRTGGILARLITRTGLELVAARMFAPSLDLVQQYSDLIISAADPQDRRVQELIRDYILRNLAPDPKTKRPRRVMMLLFRGEEAVRKVRSVIGNIATDRRGGETIRDTYGDLVLDEHEQVRYFEPAVLASPMLEEAGLKLKLWARYSDSDGGIVNGTLVYGPDETTHRTARQRDRFSLSHRPLHCRNQSPSHERRRGFRVLRPRPRSFAHQAQRRGGCQGQGRVGKGIRVQSAGGGRETIGRNPRPNLWRQSV